MTASTNIISKVERRFSLSRLCCVFLSVVFLFGQSIAASHGHEHGGEVPLGETCEVCILAVSDDEDFDLVAEADSDNTESLTIWWVQLDRLALPEPKSAPSFLHGNKSIQPPPVFHRRPDAARAPPLYI